MRIRSISITNFKCFVQARIDFRSITFVIGENSSGKTALFQPSSDSAELHDVSDRHPDVVHRLTVMMEERIKALRQRAAILATTPTTAANPLNAEEEERLKALGYLD